MNSLLLTVIGILIIFLCTSIGASFVFFFKGKEISPKINQIFLGFASGIMLSASIFSLIIPAIENSEETYLPIWAIVGLSTALGAFYVGLRNYGCTFNCYGEVRIL